MNASHINNPTPAKRGSRPFATILPENILRCMDAGERKSLGKPGRTIPEVSAAVAEKTEREMHGLIIADLARRGIRHIHAAMNKRSTLPEGHPDFLIYLPCNPTQRRVGVPWFVECKVGSGKLSAVQEEYIAHLRSEGYLVSIPRSFEEFHTELTAYLNREWPQE